MPAQRTRGAIEHREPRFFGHFGMIEQCPGPLRIQQPFGRNERGRDLRKRTPFFLDQFERMHRAEPVDHPVRQFGRDDFAAQAVVRNVFGIGFVHRRRKSIDQQAFQHRIIDHGAVFQCALQRELGRRQHDRELGPGKALPRCGAARVIFGTGEPFGLAI